MKAERNDVPKEQQLGDAPIQAEYREHMITAATVLDTFFNGDALGSDRSTGFVLLVFPFGEEKHGRCNYISNGADRDDIIVLLREQARRFVEQKRRQRG